MLRRRRMGSHSRVELPSTWISPALGSSRRLMSLSVVVLPDPLRPSSTSVSPRRTLRLRSERSRRAIRRAARHVAEFDDGFGRSLMGVPFTHYTPKALSSCGIGVIACSIPCWVSEACVGPARKVRSCMTYPRRSRVGEGSLRMRGAQDPGDDLYRYLSGSKFRHTAVERGVVRITTTPRF